MVEKTLPTPSLSITKTDARQFMLAHHGLYPPRGLSGKDGIRTYIRQVGSIQFDPINIVGRNPDLVLQSRVKDYRSQLLDELLYSDREIIDSWDKMASIISVQDWPFFSRRRQWMNQPGLDPRRPAENVMRKVLDEIRVNGPLSSLDFKEGEIIDWHWGPTKIARAALESLFSMGKIGVHHRVNNRRVFDLIERLIPAEFLDGSDPNKTEQDYQDWHILRRVGAMGLTNSKSGEYWYGILGVKSRERNIILKRLAKKGQLVAIGIDELPGQTFFIRQADLNLLESVCNSNRPKPGAAFIAALDNLSWNRSLIKIIFDFEYVWEVYKPKSQRKYGYYVLPVIYGDRFVARFEPAFDKKKKIFAIQNWWWEKDVHPDAGMQEALRVCLKDFLLYLDADQFKLGSPIRQNLSLTWSHDALNSND